MADEILKSIEQIENATLDLLKDNERLRTALIKCRDTLDEIRMDRMISPLWCDDQIEAVEMANKALGEK
jgi:hypothetical protein